MSDQHITVSFASERGIPKSAIHKHCDVETINGKDYVNLDTIKCLENLYQSGDLPTEDQKGIKKFLSVIKWRNRSSTIQSRNYAGEWVIFIPPSVKGAFEPGSTVAVDNYWEPKARSYTLTEHIDTDLAGQQYWKAQRQ